MVSPGVGPGELDSASTRPVFHPTHANDEDNVRLMSSMAVAESSDVTERAAVPTSKGGWTVAASGLDSKQTREAEV